MVNNVKVRHPAASSLESIDSDTVPFQIEEFPPLSDESEHESTAGESDTAPSNSTNEHPSPKAGENVDLKQGSTDASGSRLTGSSKRATTLKSAKMQGLSTPVEATNSRRRILAEEVQTLVGPSRKPFSFPRAILQLADILRGL